MHAARNNLYIPRDPCALFGTPRLALTFAPRCVLKFTPAQVRGDASLLDYGPNQVQILPTGLTVQPNLVNSENYLSLIYRA